MISIQKPKYYPEGHELYPLNGKFKLTYGEKIIYVASIPEIGAMTEDLTANYSINEQY